MVGDAVLTAGLILLVIGLTSFVFFKIFPAAAKPTNRMNAVKRGVYERKISDLEERMLKLEDELARKNDDGTPRK